MEWHQVGGGREGGSKGSASCIRLFNLVQEGLELSLAKGSKLGWRGAKNLLNVRLNVLAP